MTRVAVIGNAGGGKSSLCRTLGRAHGLPIYSIDQMQWRPGWVAVPEEEVKRQHDHALASPAWIIDGWGGWELITTRFAAADTIIFVDHPLYVHYWWAFKRQVKCLFGPRPDGPAGCPMLPMTWTLVKMMWMLHRHARPRLMQLIDSFRTQKQVFHIQAPREMRQFLAVYGVGAA